MREPSFQTIKLARGKHSSPRQGACVMELASMLADERFSDRPRSVSPVIAAFMRGYNDLVDDRRRQDLIRYAPDVVGTAASEAVELARMKRLVEWADERWGLRSSTSGSIASLLARRLRPADPESAGIYAIRSIHNGDHRVHRQVLALLDELIVMGRKAPVDERELQRVSPRLAIGGKRRGDRRARSSPAADRSRRPGRRPTAPQR